MSKGWYFESTRHSLAAKGVKTKFIDRFDSFWGIGDPMSIKKVWEEQEPSMPSLNLAVAQKYKHAFYDGKLHKRVRWGYGSEKSLPEWKSGERWDCHGCRAKPGMLHLWGCDNEQTIDGKQMLQIDAKLRR